jgi:hypothetical protein
MARSRPTPQQPDFVPDPNRSIEENIALLWDHLDTKDAQLSAILRGEIGKLEPLPPPGASRTNARRDFNEAVAVALDVDVDAEAQK